MATKKYRPYLDVEEIQILLDCLKTTNVVANLKLINKLQLHQFKVKNEMLSPSYISTPVPSIQEKLGFTSPSHVFSGAPEDHITPAKYRYSCYLKWTADPSSCNSLEIERAMEHRFENDMMTDEEEIKYLSNLGKS